MKSCGLSLLVMLVSGLLMGVGAIFTPPLKPVFPPTPTDMVLAPAAAEPDLALEETVLRATVAITHRDWPYDLPDVWIDTRSPDFTRYQQGLHGVAGAYNHVSIYRYTSEAQAARALVNMGGMSRYMPGCGAFHGLPACWGRATYVDHGNHHRDERWIAWRSGARLFVINLEYASTIPGGQASDPLPLAETLYSMAVEQGLLLPDSAAP